jgi:hypothetical protein
MAPETSPTARPEPPAGVGPWARAAAGRLRRATARDAGRLAVRWVRSSPGTHIWLLILAVTSSIVAAAPRHTRWHLLHHVSTNLVELHQHPLRVLVASALWIETPSGLLTYGVLFELVHAPAERWLGTWRWLFTVASAHIGATLISQKAVFFGIRDDRLSPALAHTVDIGVSYGLAGALGVLTYRIPWPWRLPYLALVLVYFAGRLAADRTFTNLGHLASVLIGLTCYALTPQFRQPAGRVPARYRPRRSTR